MPQPMKIWRENARRKLKAALGGQCVDCGRQEPEVALMFSHVIPLTDEQMSWRAKIGMNGRMVMYRREAKEGLLTLRCQSCNVKQAKEPKQGFLSLVPHVPPDRVPF